MTLQSLVAASPSAELIVVAAVLLFGLVLAILSGLRPATGPDVLERCEASLTGARERALLLVIVVTAALVRTIGWSRPLTPPFWFAQITTLSIAKMRSEGTLWRHWIQAFGNYQVSRDFYSVVMLPVSAGIQLLLGPRFHLPTLAGAVWGTGAVVLAWALGRTVHTKTFGLVFATLVAVSPLEVTWSRLGGIVIGAAPHVLLVMFLGYVAGKRGSGVLAVAAAVATWATLYHYYAARVALVLGPAALWAGLRTSPRTFKRTILVVGPFAFTLGTIYLMAHAGSLGATVFGDYLAKRGERSPGELAHDVAEVRGQLHNALCRYFRASRAGYEPCGFPWPGRGARFGGLSLLPVALLGFVGLGWSVWNLRSQWLWLLLVALGLAVPTLSVTTARRLLVFDLGWCALAAFGLLAVARSRICRGIPPAVTPWVMSIALILIGTWSVGSVFGLSAVMRKGAGQPIPYGESGFGDGLTCLHCLHAAKEWQREVQQGRFVVLFDFDPQRENRTSPGGLRMYGKLAAVAAGRPGSFLQFYAAMANVDWEPPDPHSLFDDRSTDFAAYIIDQMNAARPAAVVWHFECPTQWEEWLARQLVAAGGEMHEFTTSLCPVHGIQVRTDWSRRDAVAHVIEPLAAYADDGGHGCLALEAVATRRYPFQVRHIPGVEHSGSERVPDWVVSGDEASQYGTFVLSDEEEVIGADVEASGNRSTTSLHLLTPWGRDRIYDLPSLRYSDHVVAAPSRLDCAARVGSRWWAVDPTSGMVYTSTGIGSRTSVLDPADSWVPQGRWAGIARRLGGELVLASAEQELVILDPVKRTLVRRFPAAVWPSQRERTHECSEVVAGDDWFGTFNRMTSVLTVYNREGRPVGSRRLDDVVGTRSASIMALAAEGNYLAVGIGDAVKTVAVQFQDGCEWRTRKRAP